MNEIYNHQLSYRIYKMEIISNKRHLRQRLLEMPPSDLRAKKEGRNNVFCSFFRPLNQYH